MKKILLIRHAKSDWSIEWQEDFERWLWERWKKQVVEMWKILKKLDLEIDLIICSKAKRAILTYEWLAKKFGKIKDFEIIFSQEIYDNHLSNFDKVIDLLEKTDDEKNFLAIIWHNPLFDEILKKLTEVSWLHIPTLWIVEIDFKINSWKDLRKKWEIRLFLCPSKNPRKF